MTPEKTSPPARTISEQLREVIRQRGLTAYKVAGRPAVAIPSRSGFLNGDRVG